MMKKAMTLCLLLAIGMTTSAQDNTDFERGIFNHLGVNVGVGTEGISFGLAAPLTSYLEVGASMSTTPTICSRSVVDIMTTDQTFGYTTLKMNIQRTAFDLRANVYPMGGNSTFFLAAGLSVGGGKLVDINAHSDGLEQYMHEHGQTTYTARENGYEYRFNSNGNIEAEAKVNNVRPYFGLGFGRLVNRHRMGFRFELGAQMMDKLKFFQDGREMVKEAGGDEEFYEKLSIYPVLRLTLTGRIF